MKINASEMHFQTLNQTIRNCDSSNIEIDNCMGQRYIASGLSGKRITINGTPGNALGAYMDGSSVVVNGNAQDATGDTMNDGEICIHGSAGDATGYAMRGGRILVQGNTGYRAGIHMKAYQDKIPVLVVGGVAGSFLGEYQAGGIIIVLGLGANGKAPIGDFCGTGMHGGKIFLCCDETPTGLPKQVSAQVATTEDMEEISPHLKAFCDEFVEDYHTISHKKFYILTPDTKNPYKQLYTKN